MNRKSEIEQTDIQEALACLREGDAHATAVRWFEDSYVELITLRAAAIEYYKQTQEAYGMYKHNYSGETAKRLAVAEDKLEYALGIIPARELTDDAKPLYLLGSGFGGDKLKHVKSTSIEFKRIKKDES